MLANRYNEWQNFPLSLRPEEVENPIKVIFDFFDTDSLSGHLEILRKWCYTLFTDDYFRNYIGSPSGLFYHYQLTMSLVEAAYLLRSETNKPNVTVPAEQISQESSNWSYYPSTLNVDQQLNPYIVFDAIFEDYSLAEYREHLNDWLGHGLSVHAAREFIEPQDLVRVNDNLQALYTASWFVFQRLSEKPSLKPKVENVQQPFSLSTNLSMAEREALPVSLYRLNSSIADKQKALFSSLISIIVHKVNSVEVVINLGAEPSGKIYLLILTDNEEQRLAQGLAGMIEDSCREIANVVALVHHSSALFTGLKRGDPFFNSALNCPPVYLSGGLLLPPALPLSDIRHNDAAQWEHWYKLAMEFWKGAAFHMERGAANAALFSLHQSAECVLVALVRAVLNYDINNHNLSRLLAISEMFTADLVAACGLENQAYLSLFNVLKHAYINVRYKDGYEVEHADVIMLSGTVKSLLGAAKRVYERHTLTGSL